jgi:hypothetical protein
LKHLVTLPLILFFAGCASYTATNTTATVANKTAATVQKTAPVAEACAGDTKLPVSLQDKFVPAHDDVLLAASLGEPTKGKLCQGQVYQTKADTQITIYRSWNSTNPGSQMGKWWAAQVPAGKSSQYRVDYEICYQWSPLDKMSQCTLKAGTKVVIGTGQSAYCSDYLSYPVSAEKQIYIEDSSSTVADCTTYDGVFDWQ